MATAMSRAGLHGVLLLGTIAIGGLGVIAMGDGRGTIAERRNAVKWAKRLAQAAGDLEKVHIRMTVDVTDSDVPEWPVSVDKARRLAASHTGLAATIVSGRLRLSQKVGPYEIEIRGWGGQVTLVAQSDADYSTLLSEVRRLLQTGDEESVLRGLKLALMLRDHRLMLDVLAIRANTDPPPVKTDDKMLAGLRREATRVLLVMLKDASDRRTMIKVLEAIERAPHGLARAEMAVQLNLLHMNDLEGLQLEHLLDIPRGD